LDEIAIFLLIPFLHHLFVSGPWNSS
jgi:hypothetical protein